MENRIEIGDKVIVTFSPALYYDTFTGIVEHVPSATGDSWIILKDGVDLIYVQIFETIILIKKGA